MNGINMNMATEQKIPGHLVVFLLLAALFCTYLRISLLFIYPLLVLAIFVGFRWKLDRDAIILFIFLLAIWLFSFRNGFNFKYNLVSFYYLIPFLLLLFAVPPKIATERNYLRIFMDSITVVAVINNLIGIVQYIITPNDDSFSGIYGRFTVSQNGLSIVNAILFFYHITAYQHNRRTYSMVLAGFFIVSSVMGFYGAGLLVLIGALVLTYFKVKLSNIIQLILFTAATVLAVYVVMKLISPSTLEYNLNIIDRFMNATGSNVPRKLVIFQNYFEAYSTHFVDMLFGSGPGTFNSRSAFMVGSPGYFDIDIIKSNHQPYFFREYAYTLWNPSNTGPFDGFMNQPFTSLLAILGEYGLIFTILLFYAVTRRFSFFVKEGNRRAQDEGVSLEFRMYKFCSIFTLLLAIIDNYIEYPEIMALLLITIRFSQQELRKAFDV
jgi:hypothetical protein